MATRTRSRSQKSQPQVYRKYHKKIRADQLQVDPTLQRMQDPALVARLDAGWNPMFAGTITVSRRADGTYYIVDGQHRKVVAHGKDPDALLDAEVHEGLTLQQEAQMFLRLNKDRKAVRPFDNYRVALQAGEELEVRVHAEVTACGLEVAVSPSANKVAAVQGLLAIAAKDVNGGGLVRDTLTVTESAWGRTAESWDNMILRAVATVINKNRATIDLARLGKTLRRHEAGHWKAAAVRGAVGGGGSESRSNRLVEVIVERYNTGLRTRSKEITK